MSKELTKTQGIEEIARKAHAGEDVSEHFTGGFQAKQRIDIDFPLELLRQIDAECERLECDRKVWIKDACADKIREA